MSRKRKIREKAKPNKRIKTVSPLQQTVFAPLLKMRRHQIKQCVEKLNYVLEYNQKRFPTDTRRGMLQSLVDRGHTALDNVPIGALGPCFDHMQKVLDDVQRRKQKDAWHKKRQRINVAFWNGVASSLQSSKTSFTVLAQVAELLERNEGISSDGEGISATEKHSDPRDLRMRFVSASLPGCEKPQWWSLQLATMTSVRNRAYWFDGYETNKWIKEVKEAQILPVGAHITFQFDMSCNWIQTTSSESASFPAWFHLHKTMFLMSMHLPMLCDIDPVASILLSFLDANLHSEYDGWK